MTADDTTSDQPDPGLAPADPKDQVDVRELVRLRQRRSVRVFVLVVVVVAGLLAGLSAVLDRGAACEPIPGVRRGVCLLPIEARSPAPTQAVGGVADDRQLSVADHLGRVVVVNFWAAWCGPCRAEQPVLNDAHNLLAGADVAFLGVAIQDSLVNQRAHIEEFDVPYPSIFDPANAYAATWGGVGARAIPTTVLLDRQGRVAVRIFGELRDPVELLALTSRLLAEPVDPGA